MNVNTSNSNDSRRFALIIASSEYEDPSLQKLVAPGQDAEALSMVLRDADIGGFEVTVLKNEPSYRVGREIDMFFSERYRNDLLLLYFSCHGIKDMDGHLYYAARDTNRKYLASTAISANFVNEMMMKSRSKCQMLLLDCCYSGAFAKGMLHKADKIIHTGAQFEEGHGRIIFTASDSMQYSFEGDTCEGVGERSIFTHAIVKGLETGEADIDSNGVISYNDLYNYAYDRVSKNTCMQRPGMWVFGLEGDVIIAKNRMKNKEKKEKHRSELKDELYRVGKKHNTEYLLKLLQKEKVAEFNSIRKIEVDLLLRFCNADLSDKNLIGIDLHEVDLSGAKLVNTKLLMANLNGTILKQANLAGADLGRSDIYRADLCQANLAGADLRSANLKGMIELAGANLAGADLRSACLDGIINFDSAILYDTNFIGANINTKLVSFKGAKINKSATGLPKDSLCAHNNKYVNDIKNFSEAIERRFKTLNIEVEQIKSIEETVDELINEVQDIDDNNVERFTDTKKQGIENKLITLVEKIAYVLPEINPQTDNVFESLNSFKSLIPGGVKQLIQSIIIRNEKKDIEVSKMHYIEEAGKFRRLGKYEEAIQCYDEALNLEPDDFAILYYKGLALFDLSNYDEAIQYFDRSLKVNPKYNDAARYKELACDKIRKSNTTLSGKDQDLNKLMKEIFFPITQTSLGRRINIV